jgi:23S rRNA (uracil1939-C5)-methyltransferase
MSRRRNRKKLPEGTFPAEIENLSDDGRGVARIEGKTTFIRAALPGENVLFEYTDRSSKYDEGKAVEVDNPSEDRIAPLCEHSALCGGCSLHHCSSSAQLRYKQEAVRRLFAQTGKIEVTDFEPALTGPVVGYRTKARLGVRWVRKKEKLLVGFREIGSNKLADIEKCVVLDPRVGEKISDLKALIQSMDAFDSIPQIEVATAENTVSLVVRHMNPLSAEDIVRFEQFAQIHDFQIYGQPKGPDTVTPIWPKAPESLEYHLCDKKVKHRFEPLDFTQINPTINEKMVQQALDYLDIRESDRVIDLFCGLGNFTLPLALRSENVVGVEGSQSLVERAKAAAISNNLESRVSFYFANLYEQWWTLPWAKKPFDKLLIDPPRSGAELVVKNIEKLNPSLILYVSCHAAALARDADILVNQKGYRLKRIGVMDMFPQTTHIETMALFERM